MNSGISISIFAIVFVAFGFGIILLYSLFIENPAIRFLNRILKKSNPTINVESYKGYSNRKRIFWKLTGKNIDNASKTIFYGFQLILGCFTCALIIPVVILIAVVASFISNIFS